MLAVLHIDVFFDLICPWCLIGKAHLRLARGQLAQSEPPVDVQVDWRSVQLVPNVPDSGWPFSEFYERRLGGRDAVRARQSQVLAAAAQAGVTIDFSRIEVFPNTARAHRLIALAGRDLGPMAQERLLDRLFVAYFERGENLGDAARLAAIAVEQGLDAQATRAALAEAGALPRSPDIPGVPHFVFNRRFALSGAQPAQALLSAMREGIAQSESPVAAPDPHD